MAYGRSTTQTKPSKLKPCNHAVLCPARHHFWAATVKLELKVNESLGGYCAFQPEPSVISRKSAKKEEATAFWAVASKKFNKCAVAVAS